MMIVIVTVIVFQSFDRYSMKPRLLYSNLIVYYTEEFITLQDK